MVKHYRTLYPDDKDLSFWAVCDTVDEPVDEDDVLCRVLFSPDRFSPDTVAHESAHAALHFVRVAGLDLTVEASEELYASFLEHTVKTILDNKPKGW